MAARNRPSQPSNASAGAVAMGPEARGSARLPLNGGYVAASEYIRLGRPIQLGTGASVVHQLSQGVLEEVYLWCSNRSANAVTLYLNFNGDSSMAAGNTVLTTIAPQTGLYLVWPGIPHSAPNLDNFSSAGNQFIYAKASAGTALQLFGYVVRHYPRDPSNVDLAGYSYGPLAE